MNPTRTPEQILARMSYADKLAQLQIVWKPDSSDARKLASGGAGALFWPASAADTNALQRAAVEQSRHGIPLLIGLDVVHGQFTIFPTPLAQAASFDPEVAATDARISAMESRSAGVNWTFSPMIDVSRDPRWGRVVEGFGEDPYLNAVFGVAKINGYQGSSLASGTSIAACVKHFVGYSAAEGGRDYNTADISVQRLRDIYLEPFRAAVRSKVGSVMASFNTVSGVPMHANRELLTDVLKSEWQHAGVVVADAGGVGELVQHGIASDAADAGRLALGAGLDVEMGGSLLIDGVPIIPEGRVDPARIDDAVLRVLRLKEALGLFDNPYVDESSAATGPTEKTLAAARSTASRCAVLLKNDDNILPLAANGKRVLVVGPYAQSTDHLGAWVQYFAAPTKRSIADSLEAALPGCSITSLPGGMFTSADAALQEEARRAAAESDVVIVAVGEPSALSGEASSRSSLDLPGDQEELIHAIAETGKPFAVVLMTGRPLIVREWIDACPALLLAWHLGSEAGDAIADVLTGAVNPGGKLPMSFPRAVGQIPIYYNHESTGRPARSGGSLNDDQPDIGLTGPNNTDDFYKSKYMDLELGPQFPFGFGLSYTGFELESVPPQCLSISLAELQSGRSMTFETTVRNIGERDGDEVVQLYVTDCVSSMAQPVKRLRGFNRVFVPAGEARTVSLAVDIEDLGFWTNNPEGEFVVEPGDFVISVGNGTTHQTYQLVVTDDSPEPREVPGLATGPEGQRRADLKDGSYINPVFSGDHPDPAILRDGDDYYLTFSSFESTPGLIIWHSRDLLNWEPLGPALAAPIGNVFAVDMCKVDGTYFIYVPVIPTALSPDPTGPPQIYVIHAESMAGPWSEPKSMAITGHIDPGHVVGEDGRRYLFLSGVSRVPLTPDGLATDGAIEHVYDGWRYPDDWITEAYALEGPKLTQRDGWFYLTTAVGGTAGPPTGHMVTVARSRSVHGPWEDCPANPIIKTWDSAEPWWSKGHATLFEGPGGQWWSVFHGYENGFATLGRQTLLEPIEWGGDGWPKAMGGDLSVPMPAPLPPASLAGEGTRGLVLSDDFSEPRFGIQWSFHAPSKDEYLRSSFDDGLVLRARGTSPADSSPLTCIVGDRRYEIRVDMELRDGAQGGLLLYYSDRLFCGMGHDGDKMSTYRAGKSIFYWSEPAPSASVIHLRIVNDGHIVTQYYSLDGVDWTRHGLRFDVTGYNTNTADELFSLRPALFSAGTGSVRFRNFQYRVLAD